MGSCLGTERGSGDKGRALMALANRYNKQFGLGFFGIVNFLQLLKHVLRLSLQIVILCN
jgi:hypothetical protein